MVNDKPNIRQDSRFSVGQAAKILGISRTSIYLATKRGDLSYSIGRNGRKYFTGKEIANYWVISY